MTEAFRTYTHEHGGRVVLLFLLFLLALYNLATSGLNGFAIICVIPLLFISVSIAFKWPYIVFWGLIFINYNLQLLNFNGWLPSGVPMSSYNELLEIALISIALIDIRKEHHWGRAMNLMAFAISLWVFTCAIEILNNTCGLGINVAAWFQGFRLIAFQLVYFVVIFSIYINSPEVLTKYLKIWACLSLFSVYWTFKQKYIGLNPAEYARLYYSTGPSTHLVNGIIRYWSTFSDAANYGCNAAATSVTFLLIGLTSRLKKDRIFFIITSFAVLWGMFQSGTRTAMGCFFAGLMVYVVLSKSIKMAIPIILLGITSYCILAFTDIGQGNNQIRRMRSAFNKSDASANVRDLNKATMAKYLKDAPWGIGIGVGDVPARNKYVIMSYIAPDSEYVYLWIHTGIIGVSVFTFSILLMFSGACWIVLFRLKSKSLIGIGASLCCAFASIQLGGYLNQVLFQYPNGLIFFGGLAIVYILPYLEKEWEEYEQAMITKQEEKKRLKLEKKLASRV